MAFSCNGTAQYLTTSSSPVSGAPLTIACWARLNSLSGAPTLFNIQGGDAGNASFLLGIRPADLTVRFFTSGISTLQSTPAVTNQWFHSAGVVTSTTSRAVYYNGTGVGTSTTSVANPLITRIVIGADFYGGVWESFVNGLISECGIWNVALTPSEIAALAKGVVCSNIRPQNLAFYAPLIRNFNDTKGGLVITNNGGVSVGNQQRIYT